MIYRRQLLRAVMTEHSFLCGVISLKCVWKAIMRYQIIFLLLSMSISLIVRRRLKYEARTQSCSTNLQPATISREHVVLTTQLPAAMRPSLHNSGFSSPAQKSPTAVANNPVNYWNRNQSPQTVTASFPSPGNPLTSPKVIADDIR